MGLHIAIAAGGTAGHINPALALAEELTQRGHSVVFFGQTRRLEGTLVPQAGFEFCPIEVSGFNRSRPWTLVSALWKMHTAQTTVACYAQTHSPFDAAVGFGAYVELPLISYAAKHKIPAILHEQNSVPGLANKQMARKAQAVAYAFPEARKAFENSGADLVLTGNPVRKEFFEVDRTCAKEGLGLDPAKPLVLVFGGSLGAHVINETTLALDDTFKRLDTQVILATGAKDYQAIRSLAKQLNVDAANMRIVEYIDDMATTLAAADLVISRSGASSIAEITALQKPAILVPYPHATADHQTTNARFLTDVGCARLLKDDDMNPEVLSELICELISNPDTLKAMKDAYKQLPVSNAAAKLADIVEACASRT